MVLRVLFFGIITALIAWVNTPGAVADSPSVETEIRITAPDVGAEVTQTVDMSDAQTREFGLVGVEVESFSALDSEGGEVALERESRSTWIGGHNFSYEAITFDDSADLGEIALEYEVDDVTFNEGDNLRIIAPHLDGGLDLDWELDVLLHNDLPSINYQPSLRDVARSGDYRRFSFSSQDYTRPIVGLSISGSQRFDVSQTLRLPSGPTWPRSHEVFLPSDTHSQEVFITDESEIKKRYGWVDSTGNILFQQLTWPPRAANLELESQVNVMHMRYDLSQAEEIGEVPDGMEGYVESGRYWPLEDEIAERGSEIIAEAEDARQAVRLLHDWTRVNIEFDPESDRRTPADDLIDEEAGSAENIADVLIALLRSQDIPARMVKGAVSDSAGVGNEEGHTWVEAYVGGVGWVMLDPLWADIFDSFGYTTSDRVAIARIANDEQYESYERYDTQYSLIASEEPWPEEDLAVEAGAKQYMVLPGVSLERKFISNHSGRVVDDVLWEDEDIVGSLAPRVRTSLGRNWSLGFGEPQVSASLDEEPVAFSYSRSWWPFAGLISVAVVLGMIQFYRYRIRDYLRRRTNGQLFH